MNARTGRRRDRQPAANPALRFGEVLVADPWRKALALLLGVLLWYWLDRQVTDRHLVYVAPVAVDARMPRREARTGNELQVRLPTSRYVVTSFLDAATGEPLTERVRIELVGARYSIGRLDEAVGFSVSLDLSDAPETGSFSREFRISDLRAIDRDVEPLLDKATMVPARVEVRIEHVLSEQYTLTQQDVTVQGPDPARFPNLSARLMLEEARFEPPTVRLYGPATSIERLRRRRRIFDLDLARGRIEADQATGGLTLIPFPGSEEIRIADDVEPQVTIPLRPRFEDFPLPVPVLLDDAGLPESSRGRFRLVHETAEVNLQASGTLETLLSDKTEAERAAWALEQARLVATVERQDLDRLVVEPVFVLLDRTWREGLDFRVVSPPPVTVERAPGEDGVGEGGDETRGNGTSRN
jgi:hypothetical protein